MYCDVVHCAVVQNTFTVIGRWILNGRFWTKQSKKKKHDELNCLDQEKTIGDLLKEICIC